MSHYQCIVKNVRCAVRLGVYDFEKIAPQEVLVSVILHVPFGAMRRIRSLHDTVDYEPTIFDYADEVGVGLVTTRADWAALIAQRDEL